MSIPPLWSATGRNAEWGLDLAARAPLLDAVSIPRSLLDPNGRYSIFLGEEIYTRVKVYYNPDVLFNQHIAVLGIPGAGKSFLMKQLLMRMRRKFNPAIIVIDPEGEYKTWLTDARVFTLAGAGKINPFDVPRDRQGRVVMDPVEWAVRISGVLIQVFGQPAPVQADMLKKALIKLYRQLGIRKGERVRRMPTLLDVISALEAQRAELEGGKAGRRQANYASLVGLINKLDSLEKSGVFGEGTVSLAEVSQRGATIFDMHGVNELSKGVAMVFIVTYLQEMMNRLPVGHGKINLVVVADEAWKLLKIKDTPVENIVREGRKYGMMLVFITQQPHELLKSESAGNVLVNMGTIITLRVGDAKTAASLLEMWGYSRDYAGILANLERGTFLVRFNMVTRQVLAPLFLHNIPDYLGETFKVTGRNAPTAQELVATLTASLALAED